MALDTMSSMKTPEQVAFARALQAQFTLSESAAVEMTHALALIQDEHQMLADVITEHGINDARDRSLRVIRKALVFALADHIPDTQGLGWSARPDGKLVLLNQQTSLVIPGGDGEAALYAKLRARYESMRSPANDASLNLNIQIAALSPTQQVALLSPEAVALVQMSAPINTSDLALHAIKARFDGVFDDPALMACGPLSPSAQDDVQWILANHATVFQDFDRASLTAPVLDEDNDHEPH